MGGTISGSRKSSISARLPRNSRRASVYAAGTPIRRASRTTASTTWTVTHSTESSWNSFQAAVYHCVVQPSGSHVPSQRRASELVATAAIIKPMLTTNSVIRPSSKPRHARSTSALVCLCVGGDALTLTLAPDHRAPIEQTAQAEHRRHDHELNEAHDHRNRGGERIVVLLERGFV